MSSGSGSAQSSQPLWPADQIERRAVAKLIPSARNARTHSDEQVAQIAASIREWGWTIPVLVDEEDTLIAGHGRLLAALKLGLTEVPTMVARGWSDAQKRAYMLADNKLAMNGGWDEDMLRVELGDLSRDGFGMDLLGFGESELAGFLVERTEGLTDPDDAPDVQTSTVARTGEVWVLGRHRLACGDAADAGAVAQALGGVKPDLMVTDPPGYLDGADWGAAWKLFPGDVAYAWSADRFGLDAADSLVAAGFEVRAQIIWARGQPVMGREQYHRQHEPCVYAVRKGGSGHWAGDRKQSTLWQIASLPAAQADQRPVECMRRPMENNSSPGQAVFDPFAGSGTSLIAAEQIGRACHAVEIDPARVDQSIRRWQAFTGSEAILDGDGRTFAEIEQERANGERPSTEAHQAAEA